MTGVGRDPSTGNFLVARPEIIMYGKSLNSDKWEEIEFRYKPGNINRAPPVVAPHQPRLDWYCLKAKSEALNFCF